MTACAMVGWGLAYVPSAWMLEEMSPLTAAAVRMGLAGVLVLCVAPILGVGIHPGVDWRVVVWLGLMQSAVFYGATYWGIDQDSAGLAAVLANTDTLFVALLAWLVLHESLALRQWVGLFIGFAGAILATGPDLGHVRPSSTALIVLAGAAAWAIGTIMVSRNVRTEQASAFGLAGWQMLIGALMLMVAAMVAEGVPDMVGMHVASAAVFTAVVGSAVPLVLFYLALRRGPAGELSAMFFMVPIVGVITAWILLGEEPSAALLIGMIAVCVGLVLVLWRPRPAGW